MPSVPDVVGYLVDGWICYLIAEKDLDKEGNAETIENEESSMVYLFFTIAIASVWVLFVCLSFLRRRRLTKVIYRDGTLGDVDSSTINDLRNEGKIVAYHVFNRWVELRRKQQSNPDYHGLERRKHGQFLTNSAAR